MSQMKELYDEYLIEQENNRLFDLLAEADAALREIATTAQSYVDCGYTSHGLYRDIALQASRKILGRPDNAPSPALGVLQ